MNKPDGDEKRVDYVVQHRVRIRGRAWGAWSTGVPKGAGKPDAAIAFVDEKRAVGDPDMGWRVVRVTQKVIY